MSIAPNNEADILVRLIAPQKAGFSADAAHSILRIAFEPDDVARINELSQKAAEGALAEHEQQELNSYERVGHLLAILHSKARTSLNDSSLKQEEDLAAIREGIADMEAGRVVTLDELDARILARLNATAKG